MRYMVAIDGSKSSEFALKWVIGHMNRESDELFLISVTDTVKESYMLIAAPEFQSIVDDTQRELEGETVHLLKGYGKMCKDHGVNCFLLIRI